MNSSNQGKIYGFIGPKQGGKSYRLNELLKHSDAENRKCLQGDFSDGIRQTVLSIFGITEGSVNLLSPWYSSWKDADLQYSVPVGDNIVSGTIKGRDILKNTGEYIKTLAGGSVWARWTAQDILRKHSLLSSDEERNRCTIALGSVRFPIEVNVIFTIAEILNKEVELLFCNYHNEKFCPNVHISEELAHSLIFKGYKDGDIVTDEVKNMYDIK